MAGKADLVLKRLTAVEAPIEPDMAVRGELVRLVFGSPAVISFNLLNAAVAASLLWGVFPPRILLVWLLAMWAVVAARLVLWGRFRGRKPSLRDLPAWGRAYAAGAVATGALWGALGGVVLITREPAYYVFVAFLLGGMTAGSALKDSAHLPAFYGFAAPAIAPMVVAMLVRRQPMLWEMGLLLAAFAVVLLLMGRANHRWIVQSVALGLEQTRLNAELSRATEQLAEMALRDPLTGLFNRRYVAETLPREIHRAVRDGTGLVVALIDVDRFKTFNDRFGHAAGDLVLREVGDQLRRSVRAGDIASRYGGEEFLLVMAECDASEAERRLDEIRRALRREPMLFEGSRLPAVTISGGLAELSGELIEPAALIAAADGALYRAKQAGRDRIVVHGRPPPRVSAA